MTTFGAPEEKKYFETFVKREENAGNQHFLLCPHFFFYPMDDTFNVLSNF